MGDIDFLGGYHGCGHLWPFATLPGAKQCGREGLCLGARWRRACMIWSSKAADLDVVLSRKFFQMDGFSL